MKKIILAVFIINITGVVYAAERDSKQDKEFNKSIYDKSMTYCEKKALSSTSLRIKERLGGGEIVSMTAATAFTLITIIPPSVVCNTHGDCGVAAIFSGIFGGIGLAVSTFVMMGQTINICFNIHTEDKNYKRRAKLARIFKALEKSDGQEKQEHNDDQEALLIDDPRDFLIERYQQQNSSFAIDKDELRKRIITAVCAGYFIAPAELNITAKDTHIGKWDAITIDELMRKLDVGEGEKLEKFYEQALEDAGKLKALLEPKATPCLSSYSGLDID